MTLEWKRPTFRRRDDGVFFLRCCDNWVRGWAPTVQAASQLLDQLPHSVQCPRARLEAQAADFLATSPAPEGSWRYPDERLEQAQLQMSAVLGELDARLDALASELKEATDISAWLQERFEALEAREPQVSVLPSEVQPFHSGDEPHAVVGRWIDPRTIIKTLDRPWGYFNRRQHTLAYLANELLGTTCAADRLTWIKRFNYEEPVTVKGVITPVGALREIAVGGSHRTHFARATGLPWMYVQELIEWPTHRFLVQHSEKAAVRSRIDALRVRGVLPPGACIGDTGVLLSNCGNVPMWMLGDSGHASKVNAHVHRLYPGALEDLGVRHEIARDPSTWAAWIESTATSPQPIRRSWLQRLRRSSGA